jgi:hypothetical protein
VFSCPFLDYSQGFGFFFCVAAWKKNSCSLAMLDKQQQIGGKNFAESPNNSRSREIIFFAPRKGRKLTRASWTTLRYQLATIVKTKAKKIFLQTRRAWYEGKLRLFFSRSLRLSSDGNLFFPAFRLPFTLTFFFLPFS